MILAILFALSAIITLISLYFSFTEGYFDYLYYSNKYNKSEAKGKKVIDKYKSLAEE